jgi:hypothetical protein
MRLCPPARKVARDLKRGKHATPRQKNMKRQTIILVFLPIFLVGCSSLTLPKESPLFSVEMTKDAFSGPAKTKDGVYCYSVDQGPGVIGPDLHIYLAREGKITYEGSGPREIIESIRKIGFRPFDYAKEKERIDTSLKKQAKEKGTDYYPPITLDGREYRITYNLDGVKFSATQWNPGSEIYFYADHSEKFRKLRDVISELCLFYGRLQFDMY